MNILRLKRKKNEKGFTILEVLITLGLLSLIILFATKMMSQNLRLVNDSSLDVDYTQNLRIASNQIMDQIRQYDLMGLAHPAENIISTADGKIILDTDPKSENSNNAQLWLKDIGKYKQLMETKDGTHRVLASYINKIEIIPIGTGENINYLNIKVTPFEDAKMDDTVLSVPVKLAFAEKIEDTEDTNDFFGNIFLFSNVLNLNPTSLNCGSGIIFVKGNTNLSTGGNYIIDAPKIFIEGTFEFGSSNKIEKSDLSTLIYTKGDLILKGSGQILGTTYVEGDAYIQNSSELNGTLYVKRNVSVSGESNIIGNLILGGTYTSWKTMDATIKHDSSWTDIPTLDMPKKRPDSWFEGFSDKKAYIDNMKYKGGTIDLDNKTLSNVTIYSPTGDINIRYSSKISGILFAPNGKVTITGGPTFEGMIVAKEIHLGNGSNVTYKQYSKESLPFFYEE